MAKFIDKMMDIMKLNDYDDEMDEIDVREDYIQESAYRQRMKDQSYERTESEPRSRSFTSYSGGKEHNQGKVVNFQASVSMEVVVIQPETYDEAQDVCDHIKSQRPVIINLESMERNVAQRIMDFVSGACYTLNGNLQRVTNNIFIIAPENIDVAGDFREELKSNGIILPWKNEDK